MIRYNGKHNKRELLSFVLVFSVFIYVRLFSDAFSYSNHTVFDLVRMRKESVVA